MLLELAIGDAYGAGFEYVSASRVLRDNDLSRYVQHPRHRLVPGSYTDDTQMSLAVAEAMLSGESWTPALLARHFVAAFRRDPREGYAQRFHAFLEEVQTGEEFLARIDPSSDKSGAAMRAPPLGVLPSTAQVVEWCTVQAEVTHRTTDGVNAAVAAALMAHYFAYDIGPKEELGPFLESEVPGQWAQPWLGEVGPKGWMSVRAAITAVVAHDTLADILRACVAYGGDVDTVAAIALGAASCSRDVTQNLPAHLADALENGAFGRDYIVALDARLMALAG
ncbi:ADP-ribosylglycohydrolase family protein [Archangium lansingense]|uniref:ADP-ribosylglycohydrolase family protein n=1 Tax=Archangium lansingense TaxID=2995310 RepID=A0ABT3ZVZ3_9BACT|nr:ADP-ribosylglycohydrolase family protein [Archangium lansinium]MCY1073570.1 ADP-ribosylglycohydrolase family protein [Archangium lansinium]